MSPPLPRVLLALDSFKGSLDSAQISQAIAEGLSQEGFPPESIEVLPIGDGGEGTLDALAFALELCPVEIPVRGPDGDIVRGRILLSGAWAWVEAASACGLGLATSATPTGRTSFGVGELILAAVERGAREVVMGCGGTGTLDLGLGMLVALGASLTFAPPAECPVDLASLVGIDLCPACAALSGVSLVAAVDVDNILTGPRGALEFARQKGASTEDLPALQAAIARAAGILDRAAVGVRASSAAVPCSCVPGAGAAGGIAAALLALGGRVTPAFEEVASRIGLEEALERADVVVTGEGRLDATTWRGKAVQRVLRASQGRARAWVVAGQATGEGVDRALDEGAEVVLALVGDAGEVGEAIASPRGRLVRAGRQIGRALKG